MSRSVKIEIHIDTRRLQASMRALGRSARQMQRNAATRPVSAERREIQAIGRSEMAAAIAWFKDRTGQEADA